MHSRRRLLITLSVMTGLAIALTLAGTVVVILTLGYAGANDVGTSIVFAECSSLVLGVLFGTLALLGWRDYRRASSLARPNER